MQENIPKQSGPTCPYCQSMMQPTKRPVNSGVIRALGWLMVILGGFVLMGSVPAFGYILLTSNPQIKGSPGYDTILGVTGGVTVVSAAPLLIGFLMLSKKKVLACTSCGHCVNAV